jgi:hypothetical protein
LLAATLLAVSSSTGCYRKVVSAKGIGADELAPRREKPTTNVIEDLGDAVRGDQKKK